MSSKYERYGSLLTIAQRIARRLHRGLVTLDPSAYDLGLGWIWEEALELYINHAVYPDSTDERWPQIFVQRPSQKHLKGAELRAYQRDMDVTIYSKGYGDHDYGVGHLEIKSRKNVWKYDDILVGSKAHWDATKHLAAYVVVIDQVTGEARAAKADPISRLFWKVQQFRDPGGSYAVPACKFRPLDEVLDDINALPLSAEAS